MDKTEFVKDFNEFNDAVRKSDVKLETRDVAMLYAVFRKDLRADRFNDNTNSSIDGHMATEKQKSYLLNLAKAKNAKLTIDDVNKMTKEQASKAIDALLEVV